MSVGMSLDFGVLAASPALVIGGTLGLMALKLCVLIGVGRVAKVWPSSTYLTMSY